MHSPKLLLLLLVIFTSSTIFAQAPSGPTGTMADLVGTTCVIGNLSFTFTPEFSGTSTTDSGSGLTTNPASPENVAFIPVHSDTQTGFTLKPLFTVSPVTHRLFFEVTFRYSVQVIGSYEITAETASVAGNVTQTVSGAIAALDQECYADGFCTVVNPVISFDSSAGVFSDPSVTATLDVPALGIPDPGSTTISSTGSESDLPQFDSASFLYTVLPQVPLPPPARFSFEVIDLPGIPSTTALGLNNSGKVVGQYTDLDGNSHAYVSDGVHFRTIDPPGTVFAFAAAINERDDIVGGYVDGSNLGHGFLLRDGHFTALDFPGATDSNALGLNNRGQIVGNSQNPDGHGFLWQDGVFTTIDAPSSKYPGKNTTLLGINDQGKITGTALDQNLIEHSFILLHGVFRPLNVPGAIIDQVSGLNNADDAVGVYEDVARNQHGFIRQNNTFKTLDAPDSVFTLALQISDAKHVVGVFGDAAGNTHSFIAHRTEGDNPR